MRCNRFCVLWAAIPVLFGFPNVGSADHGVYEVRLDARINADNAIRELEKLRNATPAGVNEPGQPDLPWLTAIIPDVGEGGTPRYRLTVLVADTVQLSEPILPAQPDVVSSDTSGPSEWIPPDPIVYGSDAWYPQEDLASPTSGRVRGRAATSVLWCPFRYNPLRHELMVIHRAALQVLVGSTGSPPIETTDTIATLDDIKSLLLPSLLESGPDGPIRSPGMAGSPSWIWRDDPPLGVSYVVITGQRFITQMRSLVLWKARRGIAAGLATVEQIVARYPAVDAAASIRDYLKAAYAGGLKWVVLAGDQGVVPVRYTYAGYQTPPTDLHQYQICDLYFAELDGDWDANGNGVWGEYFGDKPELYAELFVGRLPFSEASDAEAVIRKIIDYESGPADGSYLTRELSVSADQMRDWSGGVGQQKLVAEMMPSGWSHDEGSMVEEPSGIDPSPLTPDGPNLVSLLAGGFGWVNYYVHGRADGFVVRSPGYLDSPRSYVFTFGASGDGNGHLNELPTATLPGIHLSGACDQGAFDLDSPPFDPPMQRCVAEQLLFARGGGAVAFVGQSRWGWVSTSYKLIAKFYEYLNDAAIPNHMGVYQAMAKVAFPVSRDLNYGNNLYGDPEMPAWKETPSDWTVRAPDTYGSGTAPWMIEVHDANGAVAGALATVCIGDSVWTIGETDGNGAVAAELSLPPAAAAILTISKPGYRITVDSIPYGIIADVGDDGSSTPNHFELLSNIPNPFNPSTSIQFALDKPGHVVLTVFDILGRSVSTLIDADLDEGWHQIEFGGADQTGRALSSGVYFAQLRTRERDAVRKMVLIR